MSNKLKYSILFIIVLLLSNPSYTQNNNWVSISNEFISVYMDTKTGRYIVYDQVNYHPPSTINKSFFPSDFLEPVSTLPQELEESPIMGFGTNAFNVTTLNIENTPVVFGAINGTWINAPIVNETSIIYGWRIGGLDIIQTIEIVTNVETLFLDTVQISYDVINKDTARTRRVAVRMVLDPLMGDGQSNAFFLPGNMMLDTEYCATSGVLPEYWIVADQEGQISPLSLKGFIYDKQFLKPNRLYLTTIEKALENIWEYRFSSQNPINGKDNAVVLFFNEKNIKPYTSIRVASTMVAIPSLINTFQNNGLEVRTSTFTSQRTTPLSVDLWIKNTRPEIFDFVELELKIPNTLINYDKAIKSVIDVGQGNTYPISWNIDSKISEGGAYDILVAVKGYQNGITTSMFDVPITITVDEQFQENNAQTLSNTVEQAKQTLEQFTPVSQKTNIIILSELSDNDFYGSTSESLSKIYQYLQTNDGIQNKQIIQMIETEQLLIQEIIDIEKSLGEVNKQYSIFLGIYERLYDDTRLEDSEQINIQGLTDNIRIIEEKLYQQEVSISNLISVSP